MITPCDHGGGIDDAVRRFGGARRDWLDLSTGINPRAYPVDAVTAADWCDLPDQSAFQRLEHTARDFWQVPKGAAVLATPGASSPIAMIPHLLRPGPVTIARATYNEHAAGFHAAGWTIAQTSDARVVVHPNNPDGALYAGGDRDLRLLVIDESFCDVTPDKTLIARAAEPNVLVLKSFGKFWGLAGVRLGMVIGDPDLIAALRSRIGPWQVSGPALAIGAKALGDNDWAEKTRARLAADSEKLDEMMAAAGHHVVGGTTLFRLYDTDDAAAAQTKLARHHIWSRIFPYSKTWLRLGLPGTIADWVRLNKALAS